MGYNTTFIGELTFVEPLTGSELQLLSQFLGEDVRDHPEWTTPGSFYHIDLELTPDFQGLRWNGQEKTHDMMDIVNFIIKTMRTIKPDFGLCGELEAWGEDPGDHYKIVISDDGFADHVTNPPIEYEASCPNCGHQFVVEEFE